MTGLAAFFRRNAVHFAMGAVFVVAAVLGLYLWDDEALPIWLSRAIAYCM